MAVGTTAGQITQAEALLGTMIQPIAARSLVNSPLPLYEAASDKQFVKLCQQLDMPKCPFASGQCTVPVIDLPCKRIHALWTQQAFVALDEMDFYLEATATLSNVIAFPTKHFASEAAIESETADWLGPPVSVVDHENTLVSAAIVNHHWIPLILNKFEDTLCILTTPEGSCLLPAIAALAAESNMGTEVTQKILPQNFAADCGFQTFAWIMAKIANEHNEALTAEQAVGWRHLFATSLLARDQHKQVITSLPLGGTKPDPDLSRAISQLLGDHGVMTERLHDRTQLVMERIPAPRNLGWF